MAQLDMIDNLNFVKILFLLVPLPADAEDPYKNFATKELY